MARFGLAEAFAARLKQIAEIEGLDGRPIEDYVAVVKDDRCNFRSSLQRVEAGEMLVEQPNHNAAEVADCVNQLLRR
jgi:hypothetical protein